MFQLRGIEAATELHRKLEKERERVEADRQRAEEVDGLMDRLSRGRPR